MSVPHEDACARCDEIRISAELRHVIEAKVIEDLQAVVAKLELTINLWLTNGSDARQAASDVIAWMNPQGGPDAQ